MKWTLIALFLWTENWIWLWKMYKNYMVTKGVTAEWFNYHHETTLSSAQLGAVCWKESGVWSMMIHEQHSNDINVQLQEQ